MNFIPHGRAALNAVPLTPIIIRTLAAHLTAAGIVGPGADLAVIAERIARPSSPAAGQGG